VEEHELVQQLGRLETRVAAMRGLVGGVTATETRQAQVSDRALAALRAGVGDRNPQVRWWAIQLLDHVDDPRAIEAIAPALRDPVPRVRRSAAHALACGACKPGWDGRLPDGVADELAALAAADPNAKVRAQARHALACRDGQSANSFSGNY
jgi:HEAT repeat protein